MLEIKYMDDFFVIALRLTPQKIFDGKSALV